MSRAIDPCAQCGELGVLETPSEPTRGDQGWRLVMHIRCACRVRYSAHEFSTVSFAEGERMAAEAVNQWNSLQASERSR